MFWLSEHNIVRYLKKGVSYAEIPSFFGSPSIGCFCFGRRISSFMCQCYGRSINKLRTNKLLFSVNASLSGWFQRFSWKGRNWATQTDWGGESLDKEKKLPFSSVRRFIWSAAGFWEGPLLLACFSPLLLRSHLFTVSFLLCPSSPSLHSRLLFCPSRFSLVFPPPLLFPIVARALPSFPAPRHLSFRRHLCFLWGICETVRE